MGMSRSEKRACRREAFRRTAEAKVTVTGVAKKRRGSRTRTKIRRTLMASSAAILLIILAAKPNAARADYSPSVPEIDPGSMASAMTLLVGGVLSLTGRARRA